jgi:phage terminase large subunit GpA-like protein
MNQFNLTNRIPDEIIKGWLPPRDVSISEWVEENVRLTKQSSSEAGPLRISRTPYTKEILEAIGNYYIEWVVMCWGRQLGKTEGVQIPFLCYAIAEDPGPTTFFLPTQKKCSQVESQKLNPMLMACEAVQRQRTSNPDDYTTLEKRFKEMILSLAWAGSATQATTRSTRYLLRDEIDEYEAEVGIDATSPLKAIQETTTAFSDRKIIDTSTPTVIAGNIWQELKSCKYVFEYWIPCPHCGMKQILYWGTKESLGGIKWDGETDPIVAENIAYYQCEACGGKITNHDKIRMLILGQWRARTSPDPCEQILKEIPAKIEQTISLKEVLDKKLAKKIGSHLPKWYGPFDGNSFGAAVKEFLEAERALKSGETYTLMRDWKKFWAARPWEEEKIPETELELLENKIDLPATVCPADTLFLSCGVDPSEGKKWFVVKAWSANPEQRGFSGHLIHYGTVNEYAELEQFLRNATYPVFGKPDIRKAILISGLDTAGGRGGEEEDFTMTVQAYHWLKKAGQSGISVVGTKGASREMKNTMSKQIKIEKEPGKNGRPIPGGLHVWEIDTNQMKKNLWFHLRIEAGAPGRFTFHSGTDFDYIKHLLSERLVRDRRGKEEWKRRGKNHWLDATIIADTLVQNDCYGLQLVKMSGMLPRTERRVISKGVE